MSIEIQKQIKENATDVSEYRKDLLRWAEDEDKKEERRERKRLGRPPATSEYAKTNAPNGAGKLNDEELLVKASIDAFNSAAGVTEQAQKEPAEENEGAIKRDGTAMHQYYTSWDQYDVDDELERIEEAAHSQQRAEAAARQYEKDCILDELEFAGDGDRKRTSKAKPRVKISVRTSGRRASPVDLAIPRKEEANRYFAEGRFREAVATYTSALDLLEKYEPPGQGDGKEAAVDGVGQETEALQVKTACLANRALALLKLEEWREAAIDCTEALRFDPLHGKATARRGLAFARMRIWSKAAADLRLAVKWDPADKKALAELQMVDRKLEEQNKEARAHAKAMMRDPTRNAVMPTRKLNVAVQAANSASRRARGEEEEEPAARAAPSSASAEAADFKPAERKPYVPRSVRVRGLQPTVQQAAMQAAPGGSAPSTQAPGAGRGNSAAPPAMNYYTFEALWARHRNSPRERVALLQKIGSNALPALLRESLEPDLVSSVTQVFLSMLRPGAEGDEGVSVDFVADAMHALARTNRFDLSLRGLSSAELKQCGEVIEIVAGSASRDEATLEELRRAYRPPVAEKPPPDEEESDDEPSAPSAAPRAAPRSETAPPALAASPVTVASIPLEEVDEGESAVAEASFSLDGCD